MTENRKPNFKGLLLLSIFFMAFSIGFAIFSQSYRPFAIVFLVAGCAGLLASMRQREKWESN